MPVTVRSFIKICVSVLYVALRAVTIRVFVFRGLQAVGIVLLGRTMLSLFWARDVPVFFELMMHVSFLWSLTSITHTAAAVGIFRSIVFSF